ncbi:MAG: hypothetical protein KKE17_12030 [Proteobacteria bacterium]|nr:hypothetical protein [Pseudomonadota bacterium]MBU1710725.1 hypothetical protein [Pseudomonadota bacterium]
MELPNNLGDSPIIDVIRRYAEIGEILDRYGIGCTKCSIGTCLLKDVVRVHVLGDETESQIEKEINAYLNTQKPEPVLMNAKEEKHQ